MTQTGITATKNGFLYVYVSNETPNINVYFDNLQVTHIKSPLLQEQSYYPFGLQMAGISDRALGKLDSKNKFDGGVNFEEDYGVNLYSTFFRNYDPQIGRFTGVDALSEIAVDQNSYGYAINDPEYWNDPSGLIESGPPVEVLPTAVVYAPSRNRGVSYSTWEGLTDGLGVYEYDGPGNGPGGNGNTSGGGGNYVNLSGGGGGYSTGGNGRGNNTSGGGNGYSSSTVTNYPSFSPTNIPPIFWQEEAFPQIEAIDLEYYETLAPPSQKVLLPPYTTVFLMFRYLADPALQIKNYKESLKNYTGPLDYDTKMFNRHEVPYRSTMEGGRYAFSKLTLASQNQAHGNALGRFYKDNNLKPGDYFLVPLEISNSKKTQPYNSPVIHPYSIPSPYILPDLFEEDEAAEAAMEILEGLIVL